MQGELAWRGVNMIVEELAASATRRKQLPFRP